MLRDCAIAASHHGKASVAVKVQGDRIACCQSTTGLFFTRPRETTSAEYVLKGHCVESAHFKIKRTIQE